jgi:hypothetical protein
MRKNEVGVRMDIAVDFTIDADDPAEAAILAIEKAQSRYPQCRVRSVQVNYHSIKNGESKMFVVNLTEAKQLLGRYIEQETPR